MKISIIISVYKDIQALELILNSLQNQTLQSFEILISEDGESKEMKKFIKKYAQENNIPLNATSIQSSPHPTSNIQHSTFFITHITQEDKGWRKNIALNNAIKKAAGEYLIFLDGDIVPFHDFIQKHIQLSNPKTILSGRRVELGEKFSKKIRQKKLHPRLVERLYIPLLPFIILDNSRHAEEGIKINPNGLIGSFLDKKINKKRRWGMMLVGCNMSCFKKDIKEINGFDEDYTSPSIGEDVDLSWRFKGIGCVMRSVRNIANTFHLYHERNWGNALNQNQQMMEDKMKTNKYFCHNGIVKL